MSFLVVNMVRPLDFGAQSRKSILIRMAERANDAGAGIFLAIGTLVRECSVSRRMVQYGLAWARSEGLVRLVGQRAVGRTHVNEYAFDLDRIRFWRHNQGCKPSWGDTTPEKSNVVWLQVQDMVMAPPMVANVDLEIPQIKGAMEPKKRCNDGEVQPEKGAMDLFNRCNDQEVLQKKGAAIAPKTICKNLLRSGGEDPAPGPGITHPEDRESPANPNDVLWALKPSLMKLTGKGDRAIGGLCRQWRDKYGASLAVEAVEACLADPPDDPVSWIIGFLKRQGTKRPAPFRKTGEVVPIKTPADVTDEQWAERIRRWVASDGRHWLGSWGPTPDRPGCRAPDHVLKANFPNYQSDLEDLLKEQAR